MAHVDIHSGIPEGHPTKAAIEAVFRDVLQRDPASWIVLIYLFQGIFLTIFVIRESDGLRKVLLLDDPKEQKPDFIASTLRSFLAEAYALDLQPSVGDPLPHQPHH